MKTDAYFNKVNVYKDGKSVIIIVSFRLFARISIINIKVIIRFIF